MSRRKVSAEEERLLAHAMKEVRAFKSHGKRTKALASKPASPQQESSLPLREGDRGRGAKGAAATLPPPVKGGGKKPSGSVIDKRTEQKLKRGRIEIGATLDLHGFTQAEAHRRLARFVARAAAEGHRAVLVITGKGAGAGEGRGVLKAQVPLWLEEARMRDLVIGIRAAGPRHGGSGALYVLLRRRKD